MEVPKVTRHIDSKTAFDNLSMEQQWALAEEIEMQQRQQAQQRKCLWITFKGGMSNMFLDWIGRQMHNFNSDSTVIIPHVNHQTIPMTGIIEHYNLMETDAGRGVIFHSNVLNLRRAYSEFRPVHGDGDCFYRSFMFSYLEQVLDRQDTHEEHRLLAAVEGVARHHAHLEWNSEFSLRHKAFKTLIKKVMRWKRHNRWKNLQQTETSQVLQRLWQARQHFCFPQIGSSYLDIFAQ
uniref:Ubiquitinyl hydrolase 1 n=1 Tax=Zea mays TaxID=4577 RepID=A0A804PJB4_MAIZE